MSYPTDFEQAMAAHYGPCDFPIVPDGKIHRFRVPGDKPGSRNGWYVLREFRSTGIAYATFGSWKDGGLYNWSSREPRDHREAAAVAEGRETAARLLRAEQIKRNMAAADSALSTWRFASAAPADHPYLIAKGVQPHNLRLSGFVYEGFDRRALLVPLIHNGELVNLQRIWPNGDKRFFKGGMVKGCYSLIGTAEPGQPLYTCEGWATGATIHEETGHAVACAMNCGNLLEVGRQLRREHPDAVLIIAGDDDRQTEGNPGKTAAIKAAATLGCGLVLPPFPDDAPLNLTDFNDLRQWRANQ